jgi:putative DNA-invertase from lambdoid prophage Rac
VANGSKAGATMQRYVSYARFSPRPNAKDCDSVEVQNADILEAVKKRGDGFLIMADMYSDKDTSGRKSYLARVGLSAAIKSLKQGDILVVRNWDRLARSMFAFLEIERVVFKKRARMLSLEEGLWNGEDDSEWLRMTMLAVFAEYQRRTIAKRTKTKMRQHQANGRYMGGKRPFGYSIGIKNVKVKDGMRADRKYLMPIPGEQETVERIVELRDERKFNWAQIARTLLAEGRRCFGSKIWDQTTVQNIYNRECPRIQRAKAIAALTAATLEAQQLRLTGPVEVVHDQPDQGDANNEAENLS